MALKHMRIAGQMIALPIRYAVPCRALTSLLFPSIPFNFHFSHHVHQESCRDLQTPPSIKSICLIHLINRTLNQN